MIAPQVVQTTTRLLEALEKLGQSAGSGLHSGGPSGQPSDELVKAFQQALNGPEQPEGKGGVSAAQAVSETNGPGTGGAGVDAVPPEPGPAERVPPLDQAGRAEQAEREHPGQLTRMERIDRTDGAGRIEEAVDSSPDVSGPRQVRAPDESPAPERQAGQIGQIGETGDVAAEGKPAGPDDTLKELGQLLEQATQPGATLNPTDVYRMQYLVGMLKVQAQTGQKASQSVTQGMESVLRQSG